MLHAGQASVQTQRDAMEAYALAKLCLKEKINYFCFKYISDEANESASEDWNKNVANGSKAFQIYLDSLNG